MPKRKRSKQESAAGAPMAPAAQVSEQDRAAQLFVESVRAHDAADREVARIAGEAAERGNRIERLRLTKDAAAAQIKRLRAAGIRGVEMAEADTVYRRAVAELQEAETGVRPHWAPPPPAEVTSEPVDPASGDTTGEPDEQVQPE